MTAILLLVALCAVASEPWKTRHYENWTRKEVDRILEDSPWARLITVPYSPYIAGDSPEVHQQVQIGRVPYDPVKDSKPGAAKSTFQPEGKFVLRWNSAATIRRALYRDAVLRGRSAGEARRRFLARAGEGYELVLLPVGQTRLPPTDSLSLTRTTYLLLKPSGTKLIPNRVSPRSAVDSRGAEGYIFWFARVNVDGKVSIPDDTSQIEFFTQVGVRKFAASFKPKEMTAADNLPDY
jgi:hypothetical protein